MLSTVRFTLQSSDECSMERAADSGTAPLEPEDAGALIAAFADQVLRWCYLHTTTATLHELCCSKLIFILAAVCALIALLENG